MYVLKLLFLVSGAPTPADGRFLKAYDPTFLKAPMPDGRQVAVLETVWDVGDAMKFRSFEDAHETWMKVSPNYPVRPDGKPNRPLTAYTCEIIPLS